MFEVTFEDVLAGEASIQELGNGSFVGFKFSVMSNNEVIITTLSYNDDNPEYSASNPHKGFTLASNPGSAVIIANQIINSALE